MNQLHRIPCENGLTLDVFWHVQKSQSVRYMIRTARLMAISDLGVNIRGENGTGKLLLARFIHQCSSRNHGEFLSINCGGYAHQDVDRVFFGTDDIDVRDRRRIPGMLESLNGGTVYLSNYQRLPLKTQKQIKRIQHLKLYRRVGGTEDIPMNLRVITGVTSFAGHPVLGVGGDAQLNTETCSVALNIPPLKDRIGDVEYLISFYLRKYAPRFSVPKQEITMDALDHCRRFTWPGNIGQLGNVMRYAVLKSRGRQIETEHLPRYIRNEKLRNGSSTTIPALTG